MTRYIVTLSSEVNLHIEDTFLSTNEIRKLIIENLRKGMYDDNLQNNTQITEIEKE